MIVCMHSFQIFFLHIIKQNETKNYLKYWYVHHRGINMLFPTAVLLVVTLYYVGIICHKLHIIIAANVR